MLFQGEVGLGAATFIFACKCQCYVDERRRGNGLRRSWGPVRLEVERMAGLAGRQSRGQDSLRTEDFSLKGPSFGLGGGTLTGLSEFHRAQWHGELPCAWIKPYIILSHHVTTMCVYPFTHAEAAMSEIRQSDNPTWGWTPFDQQPLRQKPGCWSNHHTLCHEWKQQRINTRPGYQLCSIEYPHRISRHIFQQYNPIHPIDII